MTGAVKVMLVVVVMVFAVGVDGQHRVEVVSVDWSVVVPQWTVHARLFLQEAMNLEPVGSSAVTGAALGHAHKEALAQSTSLARSPVLLVDDALTAVLALANSRYIAVRPAEKRLLKQ